MSETDQHRLPRPPRRTDQRDQAGAQRRPRPARRRGPGRRAPRRGRRPPDRPLRRPGAPLRRLLDRHRQEHGRHQAGRPEAVRPPGRCDRRWTPIRASAASPRGRAARSSRRRTQPTQAANSEITPDHLLLGVLERSRRAGDGVAAPAKGATPTPCAPRSTLPPAAGATARAHPVQRPGAQGARADLPGGTSPRPQLHRHRTPPAGAARIRRRRRTRCTGPVSTRTAWRRT